MDTLVTAVFPDEQTATEGAHALQHLASDGQTVLYALAVVTKSPSGRITGSVVDAGPWGTLAGTWIGSLIGLLGGPAGVVAGAVTGRGAWRADGRGGPCCHHRLPA